MPMPTIEEQKEYQRVWMQRKRGKAIDKLGGKCVNCGSTKDLEFDHINPRTKTLPINMLISSRALEKELEKCQLLCKSCHKEKTRQENQVLEHGTSAAYKRCGPPKCNVCKKYKREYQAIYRQNTVRVYGISFPLS